MASETLPHGSLRLGVLGLSMAGLLMGCVEGGGSGSGTQGQTAAPAAFRAGGDREVEAPEVFQVTDSGLWDGRPSLGGIWVASPNAVDPERVVIVNPATGKSVNGALFRRERDNPGPSLQISSDAAEALGILAGQPTTISVTALRKRSDPAPATAAEATEVAAAAPAEGEAAATTEGAAAETAALAAAALAATGAATEGATDAAAATATAAEGAVEGTVEAVAESAKPKTWKERRAEAKARREAEKAAKAAAAAEAEAAKAAAESTAVAAGAVAETAATAENAAVATVETAPLDARSAEVSAAADAAATTAGEAPAEPKKTRRQLREEKKAAEAAAAETAAADPAAAAPAAEPATGRSIQIASYSKESNATRAVETLAKIGITGQISKTERDGKTVWSVVTRGDEAQLTAIKGAGFADAFFLQ